MRSKHNISLGVLSILVLGIVLIAPYISHHHHEGVACAFHDSCKRDNVDNDEHNQHNESGDSKDSNISCLENAKYLTSKTVEYNNINKNAANPTLPFSFFISQFNNLFNSINEQESSCYDDLCIIYKSAEKIIFNGLRGPPTSLPTSYLLLT